MNGPLSASALLLAMVVAVLPPRCATSRARLDDLAGAGPVPDHGHDDGHARGRRSPQRSIGPVAARLRVGGRGGLPWLCGLATGSLTAVVVGGGLGAGGGVVVGALAAFGARRWIRGPAAEPPVEPLRLAGTWDLLAACLRAGLPVAAATGAVAEQLPGPEGRVLRRVAELLAIGSDPAEAWAPALAIGATAPLARAARRTARSGAAMAGAVTELAGELRAGAADRAEERAQRAGVLITGPLGLCFLPAFFCLGVLPVVFGLAEQLIRQW